MNERTIDVGGNQGRGNPVRVPITFASDEGTLAEPIRRSNVIATCCWLAVCLFAFGCAAAGIHAFFFR